MDSVSMSFTANSSNNLADIAARVVEEFRNENGLEDDDDDIYNNLYVDNQVDEEPVGNNCVQNLKENETEEAEDAEFEFAVVCRNPNLFSSVSADEMKPKKPKMQISADEMFSNGEIVPRYPLFDQSLLLDYEQRIPRYNADSLPPEDTVHSLVVRNPLRKLFREERETVTCSDGAAPGTYCIWKPKEESPEKCKKSNSTGNSSKRWKFKNLLQRSNSDSYMAAGKSAPVADFGAKKKSEKVKKVDNPAKVAGADDDGEVKPVAGDINSTSKGGNGNRLRSYLRQKRDLIGGSANVSR
ncbi:uncharacterized protein LOC143557649 [Bidens hawaiensis]|uniref:uncharacterized protein LOC143557649 n=1 Tax=Bidens hawaiensis TaxID=980011 RepID=UPI0040490BBF